MIIKHGTVEPQRVTGSSERTEIRLAAATDMTGLGANIVILAPGDRSSERHWHANSDEVLMVLEGIATVIENDGPHTLFPGDCAVWPAGIENAHTVENRSNETVRILVCGTNPAIDRVRYVDAGRTLYHEPPQWRLVADDGTVLKQGRTR